jgi:hypothetical protein
MTETLSRRALAEAIGMTVGQVAALVKSGEFGHVPPRASVTMDQLIEWKNRRPSFSVEKDEYRQALRFSVEEYYLGGTKSDFGSNTRRGAGKFIDDYTRGKLGELAFAKFLAETQRLGIDLDFAHLTGVPAQDIDAVWRVGSRVKNPPSIRVSIKTTKVGNNLLLVPESEFMSVDRRSDVYVLVRVGLPDDHLVRALFAAGGLPSLVPAVAKQLEATKESDEVSSAQIAGLAWREDFPSEPVTQVGDLALAKPNRCLTVAQLRTSNADWTGFAAKLLPT